MPTYKFLNNNTGEEFDEFMTISSLDKYLIDNLHLTQLVNGAPMIHSGRGLNKPEDGFRDLLKEMKSNNSKGIKGSTINTH